MKEFETLPLGIYPTPLHRLPNLSRELGINLWIKRDDLCGIGLGGNKIRKLRYLLADAKHQGADTVMTTGGAQSNHAMLTAACARKIGLDPILILKKRGVCERKGNQILNYLMGAEVRFVDTDSYDDIYEEMDRIEKDRGLNAFKIPVGGSNALGSLGYVDCIREIARQTNPEADCEAAGVHFSRIYHACGSGGTAAGSLLGAALYLPDTHIVSVAVDTDPFREIAEDLAQQGADLLGVEPVIQNPDVPDMVGEGYAIPSKEGNEAIAMMMREEGIVLDTCYTGKAFAGLLKDVRAGEIRQGENILFLHTGGAGGLFAQDWEAMTL